MKRVSNWAAALVLAGVFLIGVYGWRVTWNSADAAYNMDLTDSTLPRGSRMEKIGQFGDSFGIASSIFSMLAMFGAAVAVFLQHLELQGQKNLQQKLLSDQKKISEAEAVRSIAASITAWTTLTDRASYDSQKSLTIDRVQLAFQELPNRVALEYFLKQQLSDNTATVLSLRDSADWKQMQEDTACASELLEYHYHIQRTWMNPGTELPRDSTEAGAAELAAQWRIRIDFIKYPGLAEPFDDFVRHYPIHAHDFEYVKVRYVDVFLHAIREAAAPYLKLHKYNRDPSIVVHAQRHR